MASVLLAERTTNMQDNFNGKKLTLEVNSNFNFTEEQMGILAGVFAAASPEPESAVAFRSLDVPSLNFARLE